MGCCAGKETPDGKGVKYEFNPMHDNGMGCISKAFELLPKDGKTVSVMLGNWEISPSRLDTENQVNIGEGKFGVVFEAQLQKVDSKNVPQTLNGSPVFESVVVKKLSLMADKHDTVNFIKEMQTLKEVEHPHLLKLVGVMTVEPPLAMIFEYPTNGVLKTFLTSNRQTGTITPLAQINFSCCIMDALAFLHNAGVVHRDLATRNCMVTADLVVRVGDFGLSRVKFPHDYYVHETSALSIPLRWMPSENVKDALFTQEGDVWAFGVTLWEIYSYGNLPYPSLTNAEVLPYLSSGKTLDAPKGMPSEVASILASCFKPTQERPNAQSLLTSLTALSSTFPNLSGLTRNMETLRKMESDRSLISVYGTDSMLPPPSPVVDVPTTPSNPRPVDLASTRATSFHSTHSGSPIKVPIIEESEKEGAEDPYADPQDSTATPYAVTTNIPEDVIDSTPAQHQAIHAYNMRSLLQYMDDSAPAALSKLERCDVTEIARENITLANELGHGAFGVVYKGMWTNGEGKVIPCAVKTLKPDAGESEQNALLAEAYLVFQFKHKNVISCYGQVTNEKETLILFEFMEKGSLFGYLKFNTEPSLERKMKMAIDIANGMQYLAYHNHVHRDLASRNILVAGDLTCKISDFGLSRNLEDDTYYESDGGLVPIRWTPPEAYKYKKYSSASDVWSFGILLYEIWTQAALPYGKNWTNFQVMTEVERGFRLPPPANCPKAIYELMINCWHPKRASRPPFKNLYETLVTAHDMLFSALDVAAAPVKIDTDYGDLKEQYLGVPVPSFEELESESAYLEPTPIAVQQARGSLPPDAGLYGSPSKPQDQDDKTKDYEAMKDAMSPTAAPVLRRLLNKVHIDDESKEKEKEKQNNRASLAYLHVRQNSLRKQRVVSQISEETEEKIEHKSVISVAEMKKISEEKEKIKKIEQQGIANIERALGATNIIEKRDFIESVGRAREVEEVKAIKGRKKCICRRAKCVCKFDDDTVSSDSPPPTTL